MVKAQREAIVKSWGFILNLHEHLQCIQQEFKIFLYLMEAKKANFIEEENRIVVMQKMLLINIKQVYIHKLCTHTKQRLWKGIKKM